jgi:opacity protein-like surface antigen
MRSARTWAIVGAVMLAATAANAAEPPLYQPPPAPPPVLQPICVPRAQAYLWPGVPFCAEEEFAAGWYLRGDIGFTNQKVSKLENSFRPASADNVNSDFDSAGLFGLGVGVTFNNWLRFDVTGEYRMNADYNGLDVIARGGDSETNDYRAKKSEWLFLANAYLDLGTWWCVTPFVGAGVGFSRVSISGFTDVNTPNSGVAFADTESQWNFAWALHAGLAYQVTNNLAFEFAYRYVSLGDGITGDARDYLGNNIANNPTTFKDITSHDFRLGMRWTCCDEPAPAPPPPVMYQPPPPVYQPPPPPVYQQPQVYAPPVMRKG